MPPGKMNVACICFDSDLTRLVSVSQSPVPTDRYLLFEDRRYVPRMRLTKASYFPDLATACDECVLFEREGISFANAPEEAVVRRQLPPPLNQVLYYYEVVVCLWLDYAPADITEADWKFVLDHCKLLQQHQQIVSPDKTPQTISWNRPFEYDSDMSDADISDSDDDASDDGSSDGEESTLVDTPAEDVVALLMMDE